MSESFEEFASAETETSEELFEEIRIVSSEDSGGESHKNNATVRNAILYIGVCFFVLFSGHAPFRSLLPALRPQSGPVFVAINFLAYAIGSLVNPKFLINRRRLCFTFSALAHAQWMAILQIPNTAGNVGYDILNAVSSIINGFGAGLLWSTEGGWMAAFCQSNASSTSASYYTGIFLFFYGASGFIGNTVSALTLYFLPSTAITSVVWVLFCVATLGAIILLLSPSKFLYEHDGSLVEKKTTSPLQLMSGGVSKRFHNQNSAPKINFKRWLTIKTLFSETVFLPSIPGIAALSSVSVFSWVMIPTLLSASYGTTEKSINAAKMDNTNQTFIVPALFAIYAIANAFGAPLSSLLHKKIAIEKVFSLAALTLVVPTMVYFMFFHNMLSADTQFYVLGVTSIIFGIVVGTFNNCLYAYFATHITLDKAKETSLPPENQPFLSAEAYCFHGFLYCVFYTIFSTLVAFVPLLWMALLVALCSLFAAFSFNFKCCLYHSKRESSVPTEKNFPVANAQHFTNLPPFDYLENDERQLNLDGITCFCEKPLCTGCEMTPEIEPEKSAKFIEFENAMMQYEEEFTYNDEARLKE